MENILDEYFGTPAQQGLQRRAHDLWRIVKGDPRFSCHGRAVELTDPDSGSADLQAALARLQGVGPMDSVEADHSNQWIASLEDLGLQTDAYVTWLGGPDSLSAAKALLTRRSLPVDLTSLTIDADTPGEVLDKMSVLASSCDVLMPMGSFLRGLEGPSVVIAAFDQEGRAVGASASIAQTHHSHPNAGLAYWGMLATSPDRRGEGIALVLGGKVLAEMHSRYGFEQFRTGVRSGNAPSEALCAKLDFSPSHFRDIMAIYPPAFADGQITK